MTDVSRTKRTAAALVVALLAGAVALHLGSRAASTPGGTESATATAPRYHCPMHPTMVSDRPGDCPICGMRLVPIEEDAGAHAPPAHAGHSGHAPENVHSPAGAGPVVDGRAPIRLPEQRRQIIGVRTTAVERRPLVRTIKTVGRVTSDETRLHHVHAKVAGWVERLYANATGQPVKAGEPLLTLYSPELVASAQEYLIALRGRETLTDATLPSARTSGEQLLASARRRLLLFDISPQQIRALEESGVAPTTMTLHAPISGHILTRNVTQGEKIEPGLNLLDIADLSHVWVLADIYEYELPFIRVGQRATMTLSYLPDRTFEGTVTLIYPVLAEATRTVKVRIEFPNPGFTLRPEMYAEVEIRSDLGEALVIPESAVISTGQRDIAFVDHGGGTLEPRELKIGARLADAYEVLDGLAEGDRVVTSGNFLIDSESKLKAALAEMGSGTSGTAAGHSH